MSTPAQAFGASLEPEFELLIHCAQPHPDETASRVVDLLHGDLDWRKLTGLARSHGLSPIVFTRLDPLLPRPLPESVRPLKQDAVALIQHALIHTAEMARLVPYLQAHGIDTIVFKGPALAQGLYGRIALRAFLDLDLWVQPHNVEKAWTLLEAEGYACEYNVAREQLPALIKAGNHLPLLTSNNECIELHWTLFARTRAIAFDAAGAWKRRVPLDFPELTVMTLAPRDLVHFLCLHGTKHVWSRLSWLTDLVWFMDKYPAFDWEALLDEAQQSGTQRMILISLQLAHELFGSPLNAGVIRRMEKDGQAYTLARWMWQRVQGGNQELVTGRELVELVLRTRERYRDRGRDLYYHFMAPRPNNIRETQSFSRMPGAFGLNRLWYLVRKYGMARKPAG